MAIKITIILEDVPENSEISEDEIKEFSEYISENGLRGIDV